MHTVGGNIDDPEQKYNGKLLKQHPPTIVIVN